MNAEISQPEINFINDSLLKDIRMDGRSLNENRIFRFKINPLPQCLGSCSIIYSENQSEIIISLKGQIVEYKNIEELSIGFNLESTKEISDHNSIKQRMINLINNMQIKFFKKYNFIILKGKLAWKFNIDVIIIGTISLSEIQQLSFGVRSCFLYSKIPKISPSFNPETKKLNYELEEAYVKLDLMEFPLILSFTFYLTKIISDPNESEIHSTKNITFISCTQSGIVCAIEKQFESKGNIDSLIMKSQEYSKKMCDKMIVPNNINIDKYLRIDESE